MQPLILICSLLGALAAFGVGVLLAFRQRCYRRHVAYDARRDWRYDFSSSSCTELPVRVDAEGFALPEAAKAFDTGLLDIRLSADARGAFRGPSLELAAGDGRISVHFERGARGARQVNVSPLLAAGGRVSLRGRHLKWKEQDATLRLWRNAPLDDDRVLIVAPHSDDAEIAAHGLYAHPRVHIVTLCAGNCLGWDLARIEPRADLHPGIAARIRVWDSLAVPWLAGVPPQRSIQLAYPDDKLAAMRAAPNTDCAGRDYGFLELRRMNLAGVPPADGAARTWESLVNDLKAVLSAVRPTVVVLPFPVYDNHSDHGMTTIAICDALETAPEQPRRFLMYVNHCRMTEYWPFGPAGAVVSLPPDHDGRMPVHGLWSVPLSPEAQRGQFFALEAMHDLREAPAVGIKSWGAILRMLKTEAGAKLHGMERCPNNYFRRAVRANHLFFVADRAQVQAAADRFSTQHGERRP